MLIRAGSTLLIHRSASINADVSTHIADNGQLSLAPEMVLRKTTVKAGKKDSVATLAKRYAVSPDAIAGWNKVNTNASFKSGQAVVLYLPGKASGGKKAGGKSNASASHKRAQKPIRVAKK
jgi:membrane-bound lytic murein transglycosylase D